MIKAFAAGGVVISAPSQRHLSLAEAAKALDVSSTWVRDHLAEFPHAWRLPGAGRVGELRIPSRDVEALAARRRINPA